MRCYLVTLASFLATAASVSAARTATINGFADAVYDDIPECAKACVAEDTSSTMCPYWGLGCLCVWTPWNSIVGECVAEACNGPDIVRFTNAATSACSSYTVPEPYWYIEETVSAALAAAATRTPSISPSAVSSAVADSSSAPSNSYSPAITGIASSSDAEETTSTTAVRPVRTATINGFADAIYDDIPECAKACVARDTSSTPCPYWGLGCLCVWTSWTSPIAECVAEACKGEEVASFTIAATSACSSYTVPEPHWVIDETASAALASAAAETGAPSSATTPSTASSSSAMSTSNSYSPAITSVASSSEVDETTSTTAVRPIRTATINGFADAIYDVIPECAKACVARDTSSTPCPYWGLGCLCVWTSWASPIAECVAEACKGEDVASFTIAATSACSSYTVPEPHWYIDETASAALAAAAAETGLPSSAAPSSSVVTTSNSYSPAITSVASSSEAYETTPTTAVRPIRTATINGFADAIYDVIPECAKACVARDTSSTPCPYWGLGCLCVWTSWASPIAECVAEACKGEDVASFTIAATSACSSYTVPEPHWYIDETASAALASAAAETGASASTISSSAASATAESLLSESTSLISAESSVVSTPVASFLATSGQYANSTSTDVTVIDSVTVYVTNSETITSTVCVQCVTLTGALTTYVSVSEGITVTITTDCPTSAASLTTYTTVIAGVTETVVEECTTSAASLTTYTTVIAGVTETVVEECSTTEDSEKPEILEESDITTEITVTVTSSPTGASQTVAASTAVVHSVSNTNAGDVSTSANWFVSLVVMLAASLF